MAVSAHWSLHGARVVLGLVFFVFGANYFLEFLPAQPMPPQDALAFLGGLQAGGYVFPMIKLVEIAAGAALLTNRYVPLALTLLAPIIVNIVAYHLLLAPSLPLPLTILALELFLAYRYRASFAPMLQARTTVPRAHAAYAPRTRATAARA